MASAHRTHTHACSEYTYAFQKFPSGNLSNPRYRHSNTTVIARWRSFLLHIDIWLAYSSFVLQMDVSHLTSRRRHDDENTHKDFGCNVNTLWYTACTLTEELSKLERKQVCTLMETRSLLRYHEIYIYFERLSCKSRPKNCLLRMRDAARRNRWIVVETKANNAKALEWFFFFEEKRRNISMVSRFPQWNASRVKTRRCVSQ